MHASSVVPSVNFAGVCFIFLCLEPEYTLSFPSLVNGSLNLGQRNISGTNKQTTPPSEFKHNDTSTERYDPTQSTSEMLTSNATVVGTVSETTKLQNDVSVTKTYDIISWFPKPEDPHSKVNLTILPILAALAFLVMLCLKGCTWFRESTKEKDRDSEEEDRSFIILHEGDNEYRDIDFRSDLSTPYDTYSSYMSFLRKNNNYDTVTSVRSLQGSRPYDTVTSYRSLILQRLDSHNNDSVTSYRAFLQRVKQMKDVEVQVEMLDEKSKMVERHSSIRKSRRQQRSSSTSPKLKSKFSSTNGEVGVLDSLIETSVCSSRLQNGKQSCVVSNSVKPEMHDVGVGNGVISPEDFVKNKSGSKHHYEKSPTRQARNKSPVQSRCEKHPVLRAGDSSPPCDASENKTKGNTDFKLPRFRVSFVTDDNKDINTVKVNNTHLHEPEEGKLSPTVIHNMGASTSYYNNEKSDGAMKDSKCGPDIVHNN